MWIHTYPPPCPPRAQGGVPGVSVVPLVGWILLIIETPSQFLGDFWALLGVLFLYTFFERVFDEPSDRFGTDFGGFLVPSCHPKSTKI